MTTIKCILFSELVFCHDGQTPPHGKTGYGTDQCEKAQPGGFGVTLKDNLEFIEEEPLFRASLPFNHNVVLPLLFATTHDIFSVCLILKWRDNRADQ